MKKLVLRLELEDDKAKQKAMRTVSTLQGIDSIAMDMKEKKMTVIGTVDPVHVASKLRKYWLANIITVGPAKEPEKKEEPKPAPAAAAPGAEDGKKEEGKKEEGKKEDGKKEEDGKKRRGRKRGAEAARRKAREMERRKRGRRKEGRQPRRSLRR